MTTGNRDDDRCAYYHSSVQMTCGGQRRFHGERYKDHKFVEPDIAKHGFEPLPSDSGTCRVCGKTPSHSAHSNVPTQPAPETGGEWRIFEHYQNAAGERTRILNAAGILVAEAQTAQHAAQIVADHTAVGVLATALELAAKRIDFLTNWIESTYGGSNSDVRLGRQYAEAARDAALAAASGNRVKEG